MLFFQHIETPASDLQLAGNLPVSVAMLAIFQLIEVPASDLELAGNLPAAVAMLAIFSTY